MAKGSANAEAKLVASLAAGKAKIQSLIKGDAADPKMATSEDARAGLYAGVLRMYEGLAPGLAGTLGEAYEATAEQAARQAAKQLGEDALQVKFSKARLDNVLQIIHSGSVSDFCAVLTHKMGEQVVTALRAAVLEVLRRQAVEGLSAADTNKELQAAWARVANDANTYKFVDRGGRIWDNARYFQMLVRTNSWRIWREIYLDTIAQLGEDLVRISADSGPEQCKVCKAWEGRILTISGKDKRFPSYQDARAAGVFHPNCTHRLVAVLEGLSDDDLEAQAAENQARVDAGGSLGPTPPKPPKPGDYVPPKGHKKPKPAAPAGPTPEELAKKKADEEAAARKKAEEEAKKAREDAKARLQKLQERAVKATSAFEAIKATAAAAAVSAANAALAVKDFGAIAWTASCDLPDPQYKDGRAAAAAAKKDAEDAAKQADLALAGVKPERNALMDALGDADADKPETVEAFAKALDAYEAKTGALQASVEEAARAAKTAEEAGAKALADFRAVFDPLDKQAKAEKAAIEPKVKALVADASKGLADLKTALRDGSTGSTDAKRAVEALEKRRDDLVDEVANAAAVSQSIRTRWESDLKTVDGQVQAMDAERRAFDAAGSRVSKALNAAKKAVADAEAKWQAGDGKGALAALLKAEGHAGTMDANFNDASFQQYQGHVASYGPKVQAVQADLARVRALVQNAAAVQPPPQSAQPNAQAKPALADTATFPEDPTKLKVVNEHPGGTTGAKIVQDENGTKWILKTEGKVSAEHIESEASADKAYRALGVRVPECKVYKIGGKTYKLSQFIEGGQTFADWSRTATPQQRRDMEAKFREDFAVDCMFANRDVVGMNSDNIMVDKDGNLWRIDNGSSMTFRAQGAKKTGADEFTEWPDDVFEMRRFQGAGLGADRMTTAELCHSAVKRDWTAALAQLPPSERKIMERRLEEVRLLDVRATDYEANGYTPDAVEMVLDGSYKLAKGGTRQRVIDAQAGFKANGTNYDGNMFYGWFRSINARHAGGGASGWNGGKFSDAIIKAAKTINHHWTDKNVNASTVEAALKLKPELEKLAQTDANAAKLLPFLKQIEKSKGSNWTLPVSKAVPSLTVADPTNPKPAPAPTRPQYESFTKELIAVANQNGVNLDVCFRAFGDQGGNSWRGTAVKTKICQLAATGREWDPSAGRSPGVWYGDGAPDGDWRLKALQDQANHYKKHPDELQRDMQAFAWMKGATQTILENLDFENNDRQNRTVLICRTEDPFVMKKNGRKLGKAGVNVISTAESSSCFHRTQAYSNTTETTVFEVPYSKITALFFMEDDRASSLFLGDGENEVNVDLTGLPSAYVPRGTCIIRDYRAEYDRQMAAFRAKNP